MRRIALATALALWLQPIWAQSVVFVSPSTQAQHSLTCSADSLGSFEELHYLAVAQYLAGRLCTRPVIAAAVGLWQGLAENSGMIDGCPNDKAREIGALLGKYYHQKAALIFHRGGDGESWLVSFRSTQPLRVVSSTMKRTHVNAATVVPHGRDNLIMVVVNAREFRAKAHRLYALLHGHDWKEEAGTAEMMGNNDRGKALAIYNALLAQAPAEIQELDHAMYSEAFSGLGTEPSR